MIEPLLHAERLLLHGQLDEAERIYSQTAAADPHNAIAVVGLARVAVERGDDALAYREACRALEIDRQNAAALRLEARLSEIMAARGEPVDRPAWVATGEKPTAEPTPRRAANLPAPSAAAPPSTEAEQAAFARNPSMADHRARMQQPAPGPVLATRSAGAARSEPQPRRKPRSIIARLLGRR